MREEVQTFDIPVNCLNWVPEIHFWFIEHDPEIQIKALIRSPTYPSFSHLYQFSYREDAIAFKLAFPEFCRERE
jgi:hypothetical protein